MIVDTSILVAIVSGIFGVTVTLLTTKFARTAQREMYPQQVISDLRVENGKLLTRALRSEAECRMLTDYVHDLRQSIVNEEGPPPPDWPDGFTQF